MSYGPTTGDRGGEDTWQLTWLLCHHILQTGVDQHIVTQYVAQEKSSNEIAKTSFIIGICSSNMYIAQN